MSTQPSLPTIILTHPIDSNDYLVEQLTQLGINVIVDPMIETQPISLTHKDVDTICSADVIVFTSKRGVQYATQQINPMCCHDKKVVVVGKKTAQALESCQVQPHFVSQGQTGKEMCDAVIQDGIIEGKKVVALLAQLADDTIKENLSEHCQYNRINIYETTGKKIPKGETIEALNSDSEVLVSFTSSSAVKAFEALYPTFNSKSIKCISIGPITSSAIIQKGQTVTIETKESTYEGLLSAIKSYLKNTAITL